MYSCSLTRTLIPSPSKLHLFACVLCTNLHRAHVCVYCRVRLLFVWICVAMFCLLFLLSKIKTYSKRKNHQYTQYDRRLCAVRSITNKPMHSKNKHIHLNFTPFFPFSLLNLPSLAFLHALPFCHSIGAIYTEMHTICCLRTYHRHDPLPKPTHTFHEKQKCFFDVRCCQAVLFAHFVLWHKVQRKTNTFIYSNSSIHFLCSASSCSLLLQLCVCKLVCLHDIPIFCTEQNTHRAKKGEQRHRGDGHHDVRAENRIEAESNYGVEMTMNLSSVLCVLQYTFKINWQTYKSSKR